MLSPGETAEKAVAVGVAKCTNSPCRLFVLGFLGGLYIAFGGLASSVAAIAGSTAAASKLISAAVFPVGLAMIVTLGAELFTGNSLITVSVIVKKSSFGGMLKNWAVVYFANLGGAVFLAVVCWFAGVFDMFGGALGGNIALVAETKMNLGFTRAFLLGVLCNILVCTAVWISMGAKSCAGKILCVFPPIFVFVLCGFEHSVANMFYLPSGLLACGSLNWSSILVSLVCNLLPVTLGNIAGGCLLGAVCAIAFAKEKE